MSKEEYLNIPMMMIIIQDLLKPFWKQVLLLNMFLTVNRRAAVKEQDYQPSCPAASRLSLQVG